MTALHFWLIALGAGLAVGPVVLHLLMQEKPKRMVFPALRFVLQKQYVARRSMRLRHWLLLLLRVGIIALVALALSRPAAATALFGSYILLGGTIVSGLFFAFLTMFWRNKSGSTEGAATLPASAAKRPAKPLLQSWPLALLSLIVLGHIVAAGYLGLQLMGHDDLPVLSGKQPVSAAIVVDTSPRMNYRFNNQDRLQRAKELANSIVKQLPSGSQLAVIDSSPDSPGLSLDIAAAGQQIDALQISYQSQPLPNRAKAALDLLDDSLLENKELYIISDMTRPAWTTEGRRIELATDDQELTTYLVDVGMKSYDNWNISNWVTPTPSITPGGTFRINCTVTRNAVDGSQQDLVSEVAADKLAGEAEDTAATNEAPQQGATPNAKPAAVEPETRTVRLMIEKPQQGRPVFRNGKTLTSDQFWERFTQVTLGPGQSMEVGFQVSDLPKGEHNAWVEVVGGDALPFDNQRFVTIRVEDAWKALVVRGPEVDDANLVEAISPTELAELGQTSFDCDTIEAPQLNTTILSDYRVVFLLNPAPFNDTQWKQLRRYVENGGSVAIFLGHNALSSMSERAIVDAGFQTQEAMQLLPGKLEDPWRSAKGEFMLDPLAWDHPIFAKMKDLRTQLVWSRLPVFMHFGLDLNSNSNQASAPQQNTNSESGVPKSEDEKRQVDSSSASPRKELATENDEILRSIRILATYNNNMPAIVETTLGQGQVITMTTPISDPTRPDGRLPWNSFAVGNDWSFMYFLLINEISRYLATSQAAALNGDIGDSFFIPSDEVNSPSQYALFRPNDQEPLDIKVERGHLFVDFTDQPGPYRLSGISTDKNVVLKGFSVNTQSGVSELTRVGKPQLDSVLGRGKYLVAETEDQIVRNQGQGRVGLEFYPSLIRLLAILFICELLFSNFFYRSPATSKASA